MIFAAGLGTRLKPMTNTIPKALVSVGGKPLLQHTIEKLKGAGFDEIIINLHHFPEQIIDFVEANNHFGIRIEYSDEREKLLNTGGAIKKASWFLTITNLCLFITWIFCRTSILNGSLIATGNSKRWPPWFAASGRHHAISFLMKAID